MTAQASSPRPEIVPFFDEQSSTFSYVVKDPGSAACAILDSVLDFDQASGTTTTVGADKIIDFVRAEGLQLEWILETHVHADHLSAAPHIQQQVGGRLAIGSDITTVQSTFG